MSTNRQHLGFPKLPAKAVRPLPMTTAQRNAYSPVVGEIVYNSTAGEDQAWDGTSWVNLGAAGGEANTASNLGTVGEGIFAGKVGADLTFKRLKAESAGRIILMGGSSEVEIWLDPSAVVHGDLNLSGAVPHAQLDAQIPTVSQKAALAGTGTGPYVNDSDARLTNARTPSGTAGGTLVGTYPNPGVISAALGVEGIIKIAPQSVVDLGSDSSMAVTPSTLANTTLGFSPSGAAGGDLSGTYPNPTIAAASETNPGKIQIASLTEVNAGAIDTKAITPLKLATTTRSFPPNGAAGGDLDGTYPNPSVKPATLANAPVGGSLQGTLSNARVIGRKTKSIGSGPPTDYPFSAGLDNNVLLADTISGTPSVTLPPAATAGLGKEYTIKDADGGAGANTLTIYPSGVDLIDGASGTTISTAYGWLTVVSNGSSRWSIVGRS